MTPHTLPLLLATTVLKPNCALVLKLLLAVPSSLIENAAETCAAVGAAVGEPLLQLPQSVQSVPIAQYVGSSQAPSLAYWQLSTEVGEAVIVGADEVAQLIAVAEY